MVVVLGQMVGVMMAYVVLPLAASSSCLHGPSKPEWMRLMGLFLRSVADWETGLWCPMSWLGWPLDMGP